MGIGSGLGKYIGYAIESTAGTPVTPTVTLPFIDESLTRDQPRIEAKGIIAGRRFLDAAHWTGGNIDPNGDVNMELYSQGIGVILRAMFGAVSSTSGPTSGIYTHTWTSAGQPLPVTVQTGVPAINETVYPTTLAGMMMASWEIAAAAGEYVTLGTTWSGMKAIHYRAVTDGVTTNGSANITSATASWVFDDIGKPISGTGIPAGTTILSVTSSTAAVLSANASASGTGVTFTIGVPLASTAYPATLKPFAFHEASVSVAGSAANVKKLTLSGANGLATDRYFLGSKERKVPLEGDLHEVTGELEGEFEDRIQYLRFVNETQVALVSQFVHASGESLKFTSNIRLDGSTPGDNGRGIVPQTVPFKAIGSTDAAALAVEWKTTDSTP